MNKKEYNALMKKVDRLIKVCEKLQDENAALREREHKWQSDRAELVQRNEQAQTVVENIITRLKTMEQNS